MTLEQNNRAFWDRIRPWIRNSEETHRFYDHHWENYVSLSYLPKEIYKSAINRKLYFKEADFISDLVQFLTAKDFWTNPPSSHVSINLPAGIHMSDDEVFLERIKALLRHFIQMGDNESRLKLMLNFEQIFKGKQV